MLVNINLLQTKRNYQRLENFFRAGRIIVVVVGALVFVTLVVLFFLRKNLQTVFDQKATRKEQLIESLRSFQDKEAAILLFNNKIKLYNVIVKKSTNYLAHYDAVVKHIPNASGSGELQTISFPSSNTADFQLIFPNILTFTNFLGIIESDSFINDFETITMSGISLTGKPDQKLNVQVHVTFKD